MSAIGRRTQYLITALFAIALTSLAMDSCEGSDLAKPAAKLCARLGCALPVSVVVDDARNMPRGIVAHTTVSNGVCVLTFTPDSVRRRSVVAHEVCHCALDHSVLGPYGYEGVGLFEQERREVRATRCAKENR